MSRGTVARISGLVGVVASLIAILSWLGVRPPSVSKHPRPAHKAATASKKGSKAASPAPATRKQVLDAAPVTGAWQYETGKVLVGGRLFEGYGHLSSATPSATFDVRGSDSFSCYVGIADSRADPSVQYDAALEVEGRELWQRRLKAGDIPVKLTTPLTGATTLTLRCVRALNADGSPYTGEIGDLVFAEPTLSGKAK